MFLEIPRRWWKSSNLVIPKKQSRMISMVHHSPTTSRVWATEQFISSKTLATHAFIVLGCMLLCTTRQTYPETQTD